MPLLIKNGTIVTDKVHQKGDVLIESGKVSMVSSKIASPPAVRKVIDAQGMYVFPGFIDPHVHMSLPTPAGRSSDDFYTGSRAALLGGTTTIIDFVTPDRGQTLLKALELRKKEAEASITDYSLHVSPVEFVENTEKEIVRCFELGVKSFKIYMAYQDSIGLDEGDVMKVLELVGGKTSGLVTAHCELGEEIDKLRESFAIEGKSQPLYHALSRPVNAESEAVKKLLQMAEKANCPVYIVHVSTAKSLEYIKEAQDRGQEVYAETCPHYLLFDNTKYGGLFADSAPYVMSPPLRKKQDIQELWRTLPGDVLQTIGTDHCPFRFEQKKAGKNDFRKIPNGCGGVEHRPAIMFTFGVKNDRITVEKFVNLLSTMPAKIFGLYPAKGTIQEGSDADIVIWNPGKENVISSKTHHQNSDINIYEGIKTYGAPEFVITKGEIAVKANKVVNKHLKGRYVARGEEG